MSATRQTHVYRDGERTTTLVVVEHKDRIELEMHNSVIGPLKDPAGFKEWLWPILDTWREDYRPIIWKDMSGNQGTFTLLTL